MRVWIAWRLGPGSSALRAELFERYFANGTGDIPRGYAEVVRGIRERDLVRARSGLQDDFTVNDHRHSGMGRLEGAGAYIASLAALQDLVDAAL